MGLLLDFDVQPSGDCKSFDFLDTTGTSAPGGWSANGNPGISDVTVASIIITPYPTSTHYGVDVKSTSIPFPNTDDIPFTIVNTDMGLGSTSNIPSQIVSITYTVIASLQTFTKTKYVYLSCVHECCLDELVSRYAAACNCNDKAKDDLKNLMLRVQANILAIEKSLDPDCLKLTEAQNLVEWNNDICASNNLCNCS